MKILHYDCFAGISGDMNLAALIDMGVDVHLLSSELEKLNLKGWNLSAKKSLKNGISGTILNVNCQSDFEDAKHENIADSHFAEHAHHECIDNNVHSHLHTHSEHSHHDDSQAPQTPHVHCDTHAGHFHRAYSDIRAMIENSTLSQRVKRDSIKIFNTLAVAEAQVHGKNVDDVMFHEVGAVDSIIDIVGAAVCLEILGIDKISSSSVELGGGTVKCAHGVLPVPAPATAIISKSFPSKIGGAMHECTTPTGAAIIAALADEYQKPISGSRIADGIGIGHRDCPTLPNILRVSMYITSTNAQEAPLAGESVAAPEAPEFAQSQSLVELAANIDDMTAEQISELVKHLFVSGALDAWQESILMKKNRMASKVCALVKISDAQSARECFFKHSTTLGVREYNLSRFSIRREVVSKDTRYGQVRFKVSKFKEFCRVKPEFDDCAKIAIANHLPIDFVMENLKDDYKNG